MPGTLKSLSICVYVAKVCIAHPHVRVCVCVCFFSGGSLLSFLFVHLIELVALRSECCFRADRGRLVCLLACKRSCLPRAGKIGSAFFSSNSLRSVCVNVQTHTECGIISARIYNHS